MIAETMNKHLNNTDKNVLLSDDAQEAFEKLKKEPTDMESILAQPDFELPFVLETNASDSCKGAVLIPIVEGKDCPIGIRNMSNAEKNYDTSQKCYIIKRETVRTETCV